MQVNMQSQTNVLFAVVTVCLAALQALGEERPPLKYADRLTQIVYAMFPDKPRNMSFVEYFGNYTDLNANLTMALEKLEFGIMDPETLDVAIKLAEDMHHLRKTREARSARRQWFTYHEMPYAWSIEKRNKLVQFMQHSCYSTRYEVNKMKIIRQKYRNSTVYLMGLFFGNNMELKVTAGQVYSTMQQMDDSNDLLWYIFHYNKLLNIQVDITNNAEYVFLLQGRLNEGVTHLKADEGLVPGVPPLPRNSEEAANIDSDNLSDKKK